MARMTAVLVWLTLASFAWGDLKISGELKVDRDKLVKLTAEGMPDGSGLIWDFDEDRLDAEELPVVKYDKDGKVTSAQPSGRLIFVGPPGTYKIKLRSINGNRVETARATVVIGDGKPPVPPVPPGPTPPPFPPVPPPDDAPIKAPGFRVLIVYETAQLSKLPAKQLLIIESQTVRSYLKKKCVTDKDNPQGAYRMWDPDVALDGVPKDWSDALKRPRKSLPWLIVSNGVTGWEGPLPADTDAAMAIFQKYAPAGEK